MNYYNESDQKAAAWLRSLIKANLIPNGHVDERDIRKVQPGELGGYTQCHFFAGIGGWPYALKLAGWSAHKPIWTASCPCQPFSVGATDKAEGTGDSRDMWPPFFKLTRECGPTIVIGEQVKNAISWGWWDRAKMDLESLNYSAAAAVMRNDSIGGLDQRKRLYWIANSGGEGWKRPEQIEGVSSRASEAFSEHSNHFAFARRALGGDFQHLLPCDGISIGVERDALKGFGNAINPQLAAIFIQAAIEAIEMT